MPVNSSIKNLSNLEKRSLSLLPLLLSPKKFMVLKEPFESLTDEERKLFSNYLNYVFIHKSIIILESKMHTKNFLSHTNVYI